jgi:rSAM/selenodomain-associated transferase 1
MSLKALIVFAKDPAEGRVKTRLAWSLGDDFATWFYKKCVANVLNELRKLSHDIDVYFFSDKGRLQKNNLAKMNFIYRKQNGNDLGERMKNSFAEVFNDGFRKALIIGADIPDISCKMLEEAFGLLDESDVVLGPSKDGGYYLLGMKEQNNFLFSGIDWGSKKVLTQTLHKLNEKRRKIKILKKLNDIDTKADLEYWLKNEVDSKLKAIVKSEYKKLKEKGWI